jgi:hypothetical protein
MVDGSQASDLFEIFSSYASSQQEVNDPVTGCAASASKSIGGSRDDYASIWRKYSAFVTECSDRVFGANQNPPPCKTDSDCYTSCDFSNAMNGQGSCVVPYEDSRPYLGKCYIDRMDPALKSALLRKTGIFNASNLDAFDALLATKASRPGCQGPERAKFNGGWFMLNPAFTGSNPHVPTSTGVDVNGMPVYANSVYRNISFQYSPDHMYTACDWRSSGCFFLPANQQACVHEKICNWNAMVDGYQYGCTEDRLNNGGEFCARCIGNRCDDLYASLILFYF